MTKIFTGKIIATNQMAKTVVVETESHRPHPLYKKVMKKNKKILAHLEGLEVNVGERVKIAETRPISKRKHFKVMEVCQ